MKASILTLAIALTALTSFKAQAAIAAPAKEAFTIVNQASPINSIEVHGNVELYLSSGSADQVKVYNNYYSENALVQGHDGKLRIASYNDQKLVVWVTVNNLQGLSVYDDAKVKSFGKFSALSLDVKLFNNASAQLNVDAYGMTVKLNDRAKADLAGTVSTGCLCCDTSATLNASELAGEYQVKKEGPLSAGNKDFAASL